MANHARRRSPIKRYRRFLAAAFALIFGAISWLGLYFVATSQGIPEGMKAFWLTLNGLFTNLASTVIAFWAVSLLFERENEQELEVVVRSAVSEALAIPANLQQVRWADLIDNASEIDFVVQGWNGWGEQSDVVRALTAFFERGGVFRLYVCDPQSQGASQARAFLETRIGRTPASVIEEIEGTYRSVKDVFDQANSPGKLNAILEVYHMDRINWYFAVLFKGKRQINAMRVRDVFVFSIYSHTPRRPWLMPVTVTYPDLHDGALDWFEKELEYLRTKDQARLSDVGPNRGKRSGVR